MSHLLIVGGAPGSGKSQLVENLLRRIVGTCCTKDEIKETLFDRLGGGDAGAWQSVRQITLDIRAIRIRVCRCRRVRVRGFWSCQVRGCGSTARRPGRASSHTC
jgi:predicted ATPase